MTKAAKPKRTRTSARKPNTDARAGARSAAVNRDATASAPDSSAPVATAQSKTTRVVALLQRQNGASLDELLAETGWQPHTTRAALTGLRKKGHTISSDKVDGVRRYKAGAAQ
jgi:hypothetical protein